MLKYLKQKGQKLATTSNSSKNKDICNDYEEFFEDLDVGVVGDIFMCHSRLSMSLQAIVSNPNCLSYFVQYLDKHKALSLIKFYLDTENFKTAALTQLEKDRRHSLLKESSANAETASYDGDQPEPDDEDEVEKEEEYNIVPELKTLCESMCKPLTDDEKSQICAANSKQLQQQTTRCHRSQLRSTSSELSLYSETTNAATINSELEQSFGMNLLKVSAASVRDAMSIYQKYLRVDAKYFVTLPVSILSEISLLLCKRENENAVSDAAHAGAVEEDNNEPLVSANCFDEAQAYVLQQLEREYLNDFLQSSFYCKYCIDLIEASGNSGSSGHNGSFAREDALNICDVLHSEVTLFFFMEYLEQCGERRECLDFWTAAINFRKSCLQQHSQQCVAEAQADAMIIYDKYFSLQSSSRLRLLDKLRPHVEERICDESDGVMHCFDFPLQVIVRYLERKHFADFLKSLLFQNYVNELKSKAHEDYINATASTPPTPSGIGDRRKISLRRCNSNSIVQRAMRHRKTLSDCTTSTNTLLASMDNSVKHIQTAAGSTNLNIDARQLTNPNLLWRRYSTGARNNGNGGLQFGYINALGRYERDFPTVETFATGSQTFAGGIGSKYGSGSTWSLKKAVRKLVHLPSEDLQEEIAWQMAEMIVRDVTNVTLRGGSNNLYNENNKPRTP